MKLKILYIISDRQFGGGSRHLYDLISNLNEERFEPVLVSRPSPILEKLKDKIKTYSVEMKNRLDFKAIKKIKEIIILEKPDLVHLHSTRAGILGIMAAKHFSIPIIYTEHLFTEDYIPHSASIHFLQKIAFKYLLQRVDKIIAVSQSVKKYFLNERIPQGKIVVIYHGTAENKNVRAINKKVKIVGTVGIKDYQTLISAIKYLNKKYPDIRLEIAGAGWGGSEAKNLKLNNTNSSVKFLGALESEELKKKMAEWDIYVHSSLFESFGLAIVEAMAMGLPIVATNVGGIPELVEDGVNGFLVDKKNSHELSKAIIKLIENVDLRKKMSENNIKKIKEQFSLDKMIKETEKLYEQITQLRA